MGAKPRKVPQDVFRGPHYCRSPLAASGIQAGDS
jgi:hypothetical protein